MIDNYNLWNGLTQVHLKINFSTSVQYNKNQLSSPLLLYQLSLVWPPNLQYLHCRSLQSCESSYLKIYTTKFDKTNSHSDMRIWVNNIGIVESGAL
jgi:hypothetical protein